MWCLCRPHSGNKPSITFEECASICACVACCRACVLCTCTCAFMAAAREKSGIHRLGLPGLGLARVCLAGRIHCSTIYFALPSSPYRLVVRTSRCGRDNPGSTPGGDICDMMRYTRFTSAEHGSKKPPARKALLPSYKLGRKCAPTVGVSLSSSVMWLPLLPRALKTSRFCVLFLGRGGDGGGPVCVYVFV